MDIQALRRATAADHEAVEGSLPLMSADLTLDAYKVALERLCGLVRGWEEMAGRSAPPGLQALIRERARLHLLEMDLRYLGGACAASWDAGDASAWPSSRLIGAMYVMEGSRLGGQLIAQHVRKHFGLREGQGASYFEGFGAQTKAMWDEFRAVVEQVSPEDAEAVERAAHEMFQVFGDWMCAERCDSFTNGATAQQTGRI